MFVRRNIFPAISNGCVLLRSSGPAANVYVSRLVCALVLFGGLAVPDSLFGQVRRVVANPRLQEVELNSEATLKTDPELESILEKAERFRQEEQYSVAVKLWQSVLERSGDALFSSDGQIYFSLANKVEGILSQLKPDAGLDSYRIAADANAKAILSAATGMYDEFALQQIVRNYFLSSLGDDAALKLSSIYMDRFDFVGANRVLRKILELYPDPTVSLEEVGLRIAICRAFMGDSNGAINFLQQSRDAAKDESSKLRLEGVENRLVDLNHSVSKQPVESDRYMSLSHSDRNGLMPALPNRALQEDLQAIWQYYYPAKLASWADVQRIKPLFGDDILERAGELVSQKERLLITKWRKEAWRPTAELLMAGDYVYFKTNVDFTVWDRSAKSDQVVWRPLWRNDYQVDDLTKTLIETRRRLQRSRMHQNQFKDVPGDKYECKLFTDRVAAQMSIQDGILYNIEGPDPESILINSPFNGGRRTNNINVYARRTRTNFLTAYDARNGKMLWRLPPLEDEILESVEGGQAVGDATVLADGESDRFGVDDKSSDSPWIESGGFMAAPIKYGNTSIVPLNQGGVISIYAIDPYDRGKTVWKSYLCDEAETGASPYSPINLSIDGSDLFVCCGMGVTFIVDPSTGLIRFAKRYEREGKLLFDSGRWGRRQRRFKYDSWSSDSVVAYGRQMICFASDARFIESYDRNNGDLIWRSESSPLGEQVDYLLGVYDGILYAAGTETIIAYSLQDEGRMLWGGNTLFGGKKSYGRGMLTPGGIYFPVENQIVKFALQGENGRAVRLALADVDLGTGAPVGNLFSDGEKIWVAGANRLYVLGPKLGGKDRRPTENQ